MRVLVLGGTRFLGRRVVEQLHRRGDDVMVVHRGHSEPDDWVPVRHLRCDRQRLGDDPEHAARVDRFAPQAIVDSGARTAADVDAVLPFLPRVPTVVLSSGDVYQAFADFLRDRSGTPLPLTEDSELRRERYPHRRSGPADLRDYDKLDVEERWQSRRATVLRLPVIYGPHDQQRREEPILRRLRVGRERIPVGPGNLLWTRAHVDDLAAAVLAALDTRAADGMTFNLGETVTWPVADWIAQIVRATDRRAELVRVPDELLPPDLALLTGARAQHLLVSSQRARSVLNWVPGDPVERVAESVRWHLANPPAEPGWSAADAALDDRALTAA